MIHDLINKTKTDPYVKYLVTLRQRIEAYQRMQCMLKGNLREQLTGDRTVINSSLDVAENAVLEIFRHQLGNLLTEKSKLAKKQAEELLDHVIEPIGNKGFVHYIVEPTLWGWSYSWCLYLGIVCIGLYQATSYNIFLLLTATLSVFYLYYLLNRARLRQRNIQHILTKGIKI